MPVAIVVAIIGGSVFVVAVSMLLGGAAWEYSRMFKPGGYKPAGFLIMAGVIAFILARYFVCWMDMSFCWDKWVLIILIFLALAYHVLMYERGRNNAWMDFFITVTGFLYIGFLGSFLIPLRALDGGQWWVLTVLPAVWASDTGAYIVGNLIGKHPMSPRSSPKKTWEGYVGGIVLGPLFTWVALLLWRWISPDPVQVTFFQAWILGVVMAVVTPIGDLGISMMKREMHIKNTSDILPGHGGLLDRVDTWLWAAAIGYFVVVTFFI